MTWDTWRGLGAGLLAALAIGCSVPVATGLEEASANRVVVALEHAGVAAVKESDPVNEGRWLVSVARDDASAAVTILSQENLPAPASPSVLEALGEGSLVPSRTAEHAKLIAGTAGDLERSLRAIEGVLSVRVHLAVPVRSALTTEAKEPAPTASVLLGYRGANPPLPVADIQRLVAGAVPGLSAEQVSVVIAAATTPPKAADRELARFGPITVTRASLISLRVVVVAAALLNVILLGLLLALWTRVRRTQAALAEARAALEAPAQNPR
jgi:type III secretion system YscJ/HrcJ family lipoprotein